MTNPLVDLLDNETYDMLFNEALLPILQDTELRNNLITAEVRKAIVRSLLDIEETDSHVRFTFLMMTLTVSKETLSVNISVNLS